MKAARQHRRQSHLQLVRELPDDLERALEVIVRIWSTDAQILFMFGLESTYFRDTYFQRLLGVLTSASVAYTGLI